MGETAPPDAAEEVEYLPAGRLGMFAEELSDRAGEAWQQLAVGGSGQAMVGSLDDFLGGDSRCAEAAERRKPRRRAMDATLSPVWAWRRK